jgi:hypothetical protein
VTIKESRHTLKSKLASQERHLVDSIKQKINQNQLVVTKADKGKTLVMLHKDDYNNKIEEFITNNNYMTLPCNTTNKQQRNIKISINTCNCIINNKWKYSNMNQKAPYIYGTIKLHKELKPIRLTVNWKVSPGYKLAKYTATQLSHRLQLPYVYNIKDSISHIHSFESLKINRNIRLCSFDIENMYTNIPFVEVKNVINRNP